MLDSSVMIDVDKKMKSWRHHVAYALAAMLISPLWFLLLMLLEPEIVSHTLPLAFAGPISASIVALALCTSALLLYLLARVVIESAPLPATVLLGAALPIVGGALVAGELQCVSWLIQPDGGFAGLTAAVQNLPTVVFFGSALGIKFLPFGVISVFALRWTSKALRQSVILKRILGNQSAT